MSGPENARLSAARRRANSIPIEVSEVAFEGSFINVHAHDAGGRPTWCRCGTIPASPTPGVGEQLELAFAPDNAVVLADAGRQEPALRAGPLNALVHRYGKPLTGVIVALTASWLLPW